MNTICPYCQQLFTIKVKLAAEDYLDDYNQSLENMQGGTISDKCYNRNQDTQDMKLKYLDKGTKKYKLRTDRPSETIHDMEGVSNVAEFIQNKLVGRCPYCKQIISGINPPEFNDVYHNDGYRNFDSPEWSSNETKDDSYKSHSGVKIPEEQLNKQINLDEIVQRIKKKYRENNNVESSR